MWYNMSGRWRADVSLQPLHGGSVSPKALTVPAMLTLEWCSTKLRYLLQLLTGELASVVYKITSASQADCMS